MVLFENMDLRELVPSIIDEIGHRSEKAEFSICNTGFRMMRLI